MKDKQAAPLKPVDYLVLVALAEQDRHGYGIVKDIERLSDGQIRMVPGNLYPVLGRLVDEGLVREAPTKAGDARRRHYRLTAAGRRALTAETRRMETLLRRPEIARLARGEGSA